MSTCTMADLRLLADDLTGALDSACAFAADDDPVAVVPQLTSLYQAHAAGRRHAAVSTETRHADAATAIERVQTAVSALRTALPSSPHWFKKIDSVMRGNPVAETVAMMVAAGFDRCAFVPAFPDQGRMTKGGQQFARQADGRWRQAGPDLVAAFADHGFKAVVWSDGPLRWPDDASALIVDADTNEALQAKTDAIRAAVPICLWAGAGGLSEALGLQAPLRPVPPLRLVISGTNHPATVEQLRVLLQGSETTQLVSVDGGPLDLVDAPCSVLVPAVSLQSAETVDAALERSLPSLTPLLPQPEGIFVTGGETLSRVLTACAADGIDCTGRIAPGVPTGRISGGPWHGVPIVTKSGGFGGPSLIADLVRRPKSDGR